MNNGQKRCVSILIPTYNEQENVVPLYHAILAQFKTHLPQYGYEIVFIDNASTDETRARLCELCDRDARVRAIFNARNFGQFHSPFYGICQTTGDCTISMCADFQDPVEMIPVLVHKWEAGYRVVCAVKEESRENRAVRLLRTLYYKLIRRISEVKFLEHFTGFGLYDRSFVDVMRALDDPAPFLRGIVAELGFARCEVPYTQAKRRAGRTSNNFLTLYDAAWTSFTGYTKAPVRLMMVVGISLIFASVVGGIVALALGSSREFLLLCAIVLLFGVQSAFLSVLGEYVLMLRAKVVKRPLVIEESRRNFPGGDA